MVLECDRQAVSRGSSQACTRDESGQGRRSGLEGCKYEGGLVEDAYSR
jgi:hypothetical protein